MMYALLDAYESLRVFLETGGIVMSGTAAEIRDNETIRAAYLGY